MSVNSVPAFQPAQNNGSSILHQRLRESGPGAMHHANLQQQFGGPGQMNAEHGNPQQFLQQGHGSAPYAPSQGAPGPMYGFNPHAGSGSGSGSGPGQQPNFHPNMPMEGQHLPAAPSGLGNAAAMRSSGFHGGIPPAATPLSPKPEIHRKSPAPPHFTAQTKPPKGPEKPLIPYLRFSKSVWDRVRTDHPGLQFAEIGKVIGQQWRECSTELKAQFSGDYLKEKEKYAQAQKAYLESPEYMEWLRHKNRLQQMEEESEKAAKAQAELHQQQQQQHAKQAAAAAAAVPRPSQQQQQHVSAGQSGPFAQLLQGPLEELQSMSQRMLPGKNHPGGAAQFPHQVQQPQEIDDDADDFLRAKHVASTRYRRNHKLMAEVFSDSVVPDGRMVVTEHRINLLRKQVLSLAHHQERLVADKKDMMDKQAVKKQKLMEDSEAFDQKWAAVKEECKPVTKDQYQAMVDKYHKMFEKHVADYQAQQAIARSQQEQEQIQRAAEEQPTPPAHSLSPVETGLGQDQHSAPEQQPSYHNPIQLASPMDTSLPAALDQHSALFSQLDAGRPNSAPESSPLMNDVLAVPEPRPQITPEATSHGAVAAASSPLDSLLGPATTGHASKPSPISTPPPPVVSTPPPTAVLTELLLTDVEMKDDSAASSESESAEPTTAPKDSVAPPVEERQTDRKQVELEESMDVNALEAALEEVTLPAVVAEKEETVTVEQEKVSSPTAPEPPTASPDAASDLITPDASPVAAPVTQPAESTAISVPDEAMEISSAESQEPTVSESDPKIGAESAAVETVVSDEKTPDDSQLTDSKNSEFEESPEKTDSAVVVNDDPVSAGIPDVPVAAQTEEVDQGNLVPPPETEIPLVAAGEQLVTDALPETATADLPVFEKSPQTPESEQPSVPPVVAASIETAAHSQPEEEDCGGQGMADFRM